MKSFDFLIVGAGIIGLTLAYSLRRQYPGASIAIFEKENDVAYHASGRNSGVLHAGIYYGEDSQKAKFCLQGNQLMKAFCLEHDIPVNHCGKLIVAKNEGELSELERLYQLGLKNGASLELLDEKATHEIEPLAKTYSKAIFSKGTSAVSPIEVCRKLKSVLVSEKVEFYFSHAISDVCVDNKKIITQKGTFSYGVLYNAAGLYADKIAAYYGVGREFQILPFKGLYLKTDERFFKLKTNLYPVPNSTLPFLGVHFTVSASGDTKIGPTALPALWREHYKGFKGFNVSESFNIMAWYFKSFCQNNFNFRGLLKKESQYLLKSRLIKEALNLVNIRELPGQCVSLKPGIRAQLYNKANKSLVNDFVFLKGKESIHILNAVSPAFTSSFAISKYLIGECNYV